MIDYMWGSRCQILVQENKYDGGETCRRHKEILLGVLLLSKLREFE